MANKKISELTAIPSVADADLLAVVDDSDTTTKKATAAQVKNYVLGTMTQEQITTQNITGTDTALTDTLNFTPVTSAEVLLFLNGVFQQQGAGKDYTISGSTITWLASSGSAVDMATTDVLVAVYRY